VSRIIEPITSRCAKFRFKPLSIEILERRLQMIVEAEKVRLAEDGLAAIIETSEGDLRKAITTLQSCAR
jgi:replication factor C subunit 2/4